jgi:hypothetical protein
MSLPARTGVDFLVTECKPTMSDSSRRALLAAASDPHSGFAFAREVR